MAAFFSCITVLVGRADPSAEACLRGTHPPDRPQGPLQPRSAMSQPRSTMLKIIILGSSK